MPLQPAYTWSETDTSIKITIDNVPIKDQSQLFCSDRVVKLNVPPYLLLLDLKHAVDDDRSTATITKGRKVIINLTKAEPGPWHKIAAEGEVAVIRNQRESSLQRAHQKLAEAQQQRQARKQREERAAVDLQIQQQKAQRDKIQALKQQELRQERQKLQEWQQQLDQGDESDYEDNTADAAAQIISQDDQQQQQQQQNQCSSTNPAQLSEADEGYHGKGWWPSKIAKAKASPADATASSSEDGTDSAEPELTTISSNCSTSSMDSGLQQLVAGESAANQAAATCQDMLLDGAPAGNGTAVEPFVTVSSSRRLPASTGPTTNAIPGSSVKQAQRLTGCAGSSSISSRPVKPLAPVRSRAAPVQVTFTELETPHLPAREQREVEIKQIKKAAGKSDSMDVADRLPAFLKDKGDAFAAQGNYMGAINAYSKALESDPKQAALWANRAAAHLALGKATECAQDCTTAIGLLEQAHATLQAAPGAATEAELQAVMLGAVAPAATAAVPEPAPASMGDATDGDNALEATSSTVVSQAAGEQAPAGPSVQAEIDSNSISSSSMCTVRVQQQQAHTGMDAKLKQLLVKLLARRATAYVELEQLQEAADDLQQALRLDPTNPAIQADAIEVSLALNPESSSDTTALKELAAARFKAADLQGAAEAFSALAAVLLQQQQRHAAQQQPAQLVHKQQQQQRQAQEDGEEQDISSSQEQQQQQQRFLLAGALSNRAACWLGLNRREECVQDCWAAFEALWPDCSSSEAASAQSSTYASNIDKDRPPSSRESHSLGADRQSSSSMGSVAVERLQRCSPRQLLVLTNAPCAQSAARTVARMAAAYVCLKDTSAADAAFDWAAACWEVLGEHGRVSAIQADKAKLQQVQP